MHTVFNKRQLTEKIILRYMTKNLEDVLSSGVISRHFRDETHREFFNNLISRDGLKEDIAIMPPHIASLEFPSPKFKSIIDIYTMDISKHNVHRAMEVLKEWHDLDRIKTKAADVIHRIDHWDLKEKTSSIKELALNIAIEAAEDEELEKNFVPNYYQDWLTKLALAKDGKRVISSGICYLDKKLSGGFKTTKLYTVAARTGCGKTAFATNIMLTAAKQGYHGLYVTIEMDKDEILHRFSSTLSGVPIEKYDNGNFTSEEEGKVYESAQEFSSLPITIDWQSRGNWIHVEKVIRSMKRKRGLSFVVVDYIQQYSCPSRGFKPSEKRQEIDYMTGRFKQLALELDFAAIMLAQLNRDAEKDGEREPRLSDIKESSSVEQDSDAVLMLFCTNQPRVESGDDAEKIIGIKIAKNRSGNVGKTEMNTKLSINKFYGI